jgi:hypothetical protein
LALIGVVVERDVDGVSGVPLSWLVIRVHPVLSTRDEIMTRDRMDFLTAEIFMANFYSNTWDGIGKNN